MGDATRRAFGVAKMQKPRSTTKFSGGLWYRLENGHILIGVDPSIVTERGGVSFVDLVAVDTDVGMGESVGLVETKRGREFEIEAPCAGRIVEVNPALPDETAAINADPLGQWLLKLVPKASTAWARIPSE